MSSASAACTSTPAPRALLLAVLAIAACSYEPVLIQDDALQQLAEYRRFEAFVAMWPGRYDNTEQVQRTGKFDPVTLHIRRVELPAFGSHVFYAEWHATDDPTTVTRQRFYAFERDGDQFRLNLHIFPPDPAFKARTAGAFADPERLDGVVPADMYPLDGCDVFFVADAVDGTDRAPYSGAMRKGDCAFDAPGTDTPIYSWSQMRLSEERFSYLDGWFNVDGTVYRQFSDEWIVFRKRSVDRP